MGAGVAGFAYPTVGRNFAFSAAPPRQALRQREIDAPALEVRGACPTLVCASIAYRRPHRAVAVRETLDTLIDTQVASRESRSGTIAIAQTSRNTCPAHAANRSPGVKPSAFPIAGTRITRARRPTDGGVGVIRETLGVGHAGITRTRYIADWRVLIEAGALCVAHADIARARRITDRRIRVEGDTLGVGRARFADARANIAERRIA